MARVENRERISYVGWHALRAGEMGMDLVIQVFETVETIRGVNWPPKGV